MPKHFKNAPLFGDGSRDPDFPPQKAQWEDTNPPAGHVVGSPGKLTNLQQFYQNQGATAELSPPTPAPIRDSDFPMSDTFTPGTMGHLDP